MQGTSYTTMEINVEDIDDNDPVFNDTNYILHVTEHVGIQYIEIYIHMC